jgi:hypothetical protein
MQLQEGTQVSKGDVKAVIEQMATVGYKELNESGEFFMPGFAKMSIVNKPATEARSGVNPLRKSLWSSRPLDRHLHPHTMRSETESLEGLGGQSRKGHAV